MKRGAVIDHCHHCSLSPSFRSWHERLDVQNKIICINDSGLKLELKGSSLPGSYCARGMAGAHVLLEGWEQRLLRGLHRGHVSYKKPCEIVSAPFSLSC